MSFSIKIPSDVIDEIVEFSKDAYPNEFFAYLEGKVKEEGVFVNNLAYYPHEANEDSVTTIFHMGTHTADFIGSVHSHPDGDNRPSRQDLRTFNHDGIVHFIINNPFRKENIRCFGNDGKELEFEILSS
jgi:proteasome lid subunit RPN8/RPN11